MSNFTTILFAALLGGFLALASAVIVNHENNRPIEDKCRLAGGTITNNRCFVEIK